MAKRPKHVAAFKEIIYVVLSWIPLGYITEW